MKFRIRSIIYSGLLQRNCESSCDKRAAIKKPAMDRIKMVFVMVFCIPVASPCWFFPSFSEVNFVRAVGNVSIVKRPNVEAMKLRRDRVPMSVWVRAFVCVTMM